MTKNDAAVPPWTKVTSAKAHHVIRELDVTGGFLKGAHFEFVDGLNCVIGGRGTGKTTVLEFIRHALEHSAEEKAATASRSKALKSLVQSNLGAGQVRLGVRTKHGMEYRAERAAEDAPQVFNEQGEAIAISFDRDLIFKADVYSQNEIEEIATNASLQLSLLDQFADEEIRRINGDIGRTQRDLTENAGTLVRLDRQLRDLKVSATEVPALAEKLRVLQQSSGPDAVLVSAAHGQKALREKERKTLDALHNDLRRTRVEAAATLSTLARLLGARIDADLLEGSNKDVFGALAAHIQELTSLLARGATKIGQQADATNAIVVEQERMLATRHAQQDAAYRAVVAKSNEESGRATERSQIQQRYAEVVSANKELELRERERSELAAERARLTNTLTTLLDDRFGARRQVTERLSTSLAPSIRVTIAQGGNREGYRTLLSEALRGLSMKQTLVADRVVPNTSPSELASLVQRGDVATFAEATSLDTERSKKVIETLRDTEMLYRLEALELEDLPRIELLDGATYKDSGALSTGQRCTAILPILLLESERPLLIDQPEDNLDNAFIYETVVKNLKSVKGSRQLIFVTHNPNIPVLGDAERVFVLESDGKAGRLRCVGSVDELKDDIELLLEGGREAFLLRTKRYGH
jgi:ATPase subunit of ABC transporter with duplicated ATPase domains